MEQPTGSTKPQESKPLEHFTLRDEETPEGDFTLKIRIDSDEGEGTVALLQGQKGWEEVLHTNTVSRGRGIRGADWGFR